MPSLQSFFFFFLEWCPMVLQTIQPIRKFKFQTCCKTLHTISKTHVPTLLQTLQTFQQLMLQTCCASPGVHQQIVPLVLLILNVPRTSTSKRAELLQTASGTLNYFNVGNVGRCCWRSDLSLQRAGTARTFCARMGAIRPWTTDTDDIRGSQEAARQYV